MYEARKIETGPLCSVLVETASHKGENQDHSQCFEAKYEQHILLYYYIF